MFFCGILDFLFKICVTSANVSHLVSDGVGWVLAHRNGRTVSNKKNVKKGEKVLGGGSMCVWGWLVFAPFLFCGLADRCRNKSWWLEGKYLFFCLGSPTEGRRKKEREKDMKWNEN